MSSGINNRCKLLVLGPRLNMKQGPGGAVVLFENLITEFTLQKVKFTVIDTNKSNYKLKSLFIWGVVKSFIKLRKKHDVVFLNSSRDYIYLLPIFFLLNLTDSKKIVVRKFGGELDRDLETGFKGKLIQYVFKRLDMIFVESKLLVNKVSKINPNTFWFPNVRQRSSSGIQQKQFTKQFVFISHIKASKGVKILLDAFERLDQSYSIDFYGTLIESELSNLIDKLPNARYMGQLSPDKVNDTIASYDVVVLPTFYAGEGYPGILIEAYGCGKPVIATRWKQVPEIVEDGITGYLVTPQNDQELANAIESIGSNYSEMSVNALKKFEEFDSRAVTKNIIDLLQTKICL